MKNESPNPELINPTPPRNKILFLQRKSPQIFGLRTFSAFYYVYFRIPKFPFLPNFEIMLREQRNLGMRFSIFSFQFSFSCLFSSADQIFVGRWAQRMKMTKEPRKSTSKLRNFPRFPVLSVYRTTSIRHTSEVCSIFQISV